MYISVVAAGSLACRPSVQTISSSLLLITVVSVVSVLKSHNNNNNNNKMNHCQGVNVFMSGQGSYHH